LQRRIRPEQRLQLKARLEVFEVFFKIGAFGFGVAAIWV
jgi:hypothetical protein